MSFSKIHIKKLKNKLMLLSLLSILLNHLIPKQDQVRLQSVADFLYRNRNFEILISAHAVEGKTNKENVLISEKRSLEVERFLLIHSVEPNQIRRLFYGNSKSPNLTKEHEALNRRVEILLQPIG
ncbi:OmpA family protein [Leptospira levettii]|uniref:OmpA family protein n=1 Tax=Leptospira levettii TaxID=2023178 RepID=UPI00223C9EAA|nr:OmpA family protein [Leptospira levettii]MCW7466956.1 OmpA family protein [Leptospira levettii]